MNDRLQIQPSGFLQQVSFEITESQVEDLVNDLRVIQNQRYGVADNPPMFGNVGDFAIIHFSENGAHD